MSGTKDRSWRIAIRLRLPAVFDLDQEGGLPERLEPRAPIREQTMGAGEDRVRIRPIGLPDGTAFDPNAALVEVTLISPGADGHSALEAAVARIQPVLDSLSFQLQSPVFPSYAEALDLTAPVAAGQERELSLYSTNWGYPIRRFRPAAIVMGGVQATRDATLDEQLSGLEDRPRAAFDWYLKGIGAPLEVDQFIFFWISFEILSDLSDIRVNAPLKLRCQHDLHSCPECGEETERVIQGATRKAFLQHLSVSAEDAAELWKARQILHGAKQFDSKIMDDLPRLNQILRAATHQEIKRILGFDPAAPPLVSSDGTSMYPNMAINGARIVTDADLEI